MRGCFNFKFVQHNDKSFEGMRVWLLRLLFVWARALLMQYLVWKTYLQFARSGCSTIISLFITPFIKWHTSLYFWKSTFHLVYINDFSEQYSLSVTPKLHSLQVIIAPCFWFTSTLLLPYTFSPFLW